MNTRFGGLLAILAVWTLGACSGPAVVMATQDVPVAQDGSVDAAALDAPPLDAAPQDAPPADAPPADAPPPPDVAPDAPPPDRPVGTCETMPVAEIASRATVRFRFRSSMAWITSAGMFCAPYSIARVGGGEVTLGLSFQCICECPAPPPPGPSMLRRADGTTELTWDGRGLVTCSEVVDCAMRGWPGAGFQLSARAAAQPVAPGRYRATFGLFDALPAGCNSGGDGTASCSRVGPPMPPFGGPWMRCEAQRTVSVEFELPMTGEVTVDVP
jgi:hypothetical protein